MESTHEAESRLPQLLERVEARERTVRRQTVLYSMIPVLLTIVLLGYSGLRVELADEHVRKARTEVSDLQKTVEASQLEVQRLQKALDEAQQKLTVATDLGQYVHPIDYVDAKRLASRYPGSERLLIEILELRQRGVGWKLAGQSPAEGFDSPSFAMYVLQQIGAAHIASRPGESLVDASRRLYDALPPTGAPTTGDLAFYPGGYALFYFEDATEGPFVLGMTPFGITALKPDFARVIGYRRIRAG